MAAGCPDCTQAATNPDWGGYHASCKGCKTRALANGPQFWYSLTTRCKTPQYHEELVSVFGEDGVQAGHEAVKAEYRRLSALREGLK